MHFAKIDGKLIEAQPGLKALCPGCYAPVIAKCGTHRIHHWAHLKKACDSWSEPETEWHRAWKNNFPTEWQEIFLPDSRTGEKHIADVRTGHGLVVEFQHSHLDATERSTRESFYQNMVWVTGGTRLKRDYPRFLEGKDRFRSVRNGIHCVAFPDECFPSAWLGSTVPVIFDFRGNELIHDPKDPRNDLYCLFPKRIGKDAIVAVLSRKAFVDAAINGNWSPWAGKLADNISQASGEFQTMVERQQRLQANVSFEKFSRAMRFQRVRRRF
ncbi:MAG TPA: competence protein CoiA family protein [Ohtaekwangia sp.]|nr:competence protein CoiA family protein [Ohtaekwangia sp.]